MPWARSSSARYWDVTASRMRSSRRTPRPTRAGWRVKRFATGTTSSSRPAVTGRSRWSPRDVDAAAAVLADGLVRAVDVGTARDKTFYEAGSVGMHAAMFRHAQDFDRGDYGAILRTIWVAFRYRPARMTIELDNETVRTRALMVTVSNGPYTGVGMTVAPEARLDDGALDVRVFRHFSKGELLRHLLSIAFGRRSWSPRISTHRSTRVRIDSVSPLPCRADSHHMGATPIEFAVKARALRVVVPADWTGGPVTDTRSSRRGGA